MGFKGNFQMPWKILEKERALHKETHDCATRSTRLVVDKIPSNFIFWNTDVLSTVTAENRRWYTKIGILRMFILKFLWKCKYTF